MRLGKKEEQLIREILEAPTLEGAREAARWLQRDVAAVSRLGGEGGAALVRCALPAAVCA
jgi:hypothetical protein